MPSPEKLRLDNDDSIISLCTQQPGLTRETNQKPNIMPSSLLTNEFDVYSRQRHPSTSENQSRGFYVKFQNLSVHGFQTTTDFQRTCGNYPSAVFQKLVNQRKTKVSILNNLDGFIEPGEQFLVLGRPGSGCTSFLKTLAGENEDLHASVETELEYNGHSLKSFPTSSRGDFVYHAESDYHFPELTARETLNFAAEAKIPLHQEPSTLSRAQRINQLTNSTLALFNLGNAADTKVGNDLIRGISGGERQRVSIAEAFMCCGRIHCWDNSTRGLDSATALDIVTLIKQSSNVFGTTNVMSLYQASQAMYDVFDKVSLLYSGRQIFFGSTEEAKRYFESRGFICEERVSTPDFLTSLTNPDEHIVKPGWELRVPRTAEEFEKVWLESAERAILLEKMRTCGQTIPINPNTTEGGRPSSPLEQIHARYVPDRHGLPIVYPHADPGHLRSRSAYSIPFWTQVQLCIARAMKRLKNNAAVPISNVIAQGVLGLFVGSTFYNLQPDTNSFFSRAALIFFAALLNATASGFEVGAIWTQRPIVEKHRRYGYYHPCAEAIASMICDLPNKIMASLFLNLALYFLSNLRRTPAAFFTYYLFGFTLLLTMSMFFRMVGYLSRTMAASMAPVAVWLLNWIISVGFVVPTNQMRPWVRWIGYINPIAYAFESMMINEFQGRDFSCSSIVPQGPTYQDSQGNLSICATVGSVPGEPSVQGNHYLSENFGYHSNHLWRNLGVVIVFMVAFCVVLIFGAEYCSAEKPRGDILVFRRSKTSRVRTAHGDVESEPQVDAKTSEKPPTSSARMPQFSPNRVTLGIESHKSVLHWENLCYHVPVGGSKKRILNFVEGWVKPGQLTALMGASGAGKTTLLDVLASRTRIGVVTGEVFVNGKPRGEAFQRQTGYVQQTDIHMPEMTVREALIFSAALRQPSGTSAKEKNDYVEQVIDVLEMSNYADAVIGEVGSGLSIEQRRRLSIAIELAAKPQLLLFVDEPTSGLDSQTAWLICRLLRRLADSGQAILCTIHQPSALIFDIFDRLLILGRQGRPIYFGDIGNHGSIMTAYFESHGARPCATGENPAEWLMDVSGAVAWSRNLIEWEKVWSESAERVSNQHQLQQFKMESSLEASSNDEATGEYASAFFTQLWIVTKRNLVQDWRVPSYIYSKLLLSFGMAFSVGVSFWMAPASIQGTQSQIFAIFLILTLFSNLMQLIIWRFADSRAIFEAREWPSKIFSWKAFMSATMLAEMPSQTFIALVVYVSFYYPVGMYRRMGEAIHERSGAVLLLFWMYLIFTSSFSHMMATAIPEPNMAINISQLLYMFCLLFCGVLVTSDALPRFWIFMYRVTPVTYLIGGLSTASLGMTEIECSALEILSLTPPDNTSCGDYLSAYVATVGGRILNPSSVDVCKFCPIAETDDILAALSMSYSERWQSVGIMFAYIAFNVSAAIGIYWFTKGRRT